MDDQYDDNGNATAPATNGVKVSSCARQKRNNVNTYQQTPAANRRLAQASIRVRTRLHRQITSVIESIFAGSGMDVILSGGTGWDGTPLGWLMEATLKVRDREFAIPSDAPLEEYSNGKTLLTVLLSRDRGRELCLVKAGEMFGRRVEGVCVLFGYLYDHIKNIYGNEIDEYKALKIVEEWIETAMVKAHMLAIVNDFLPAVMGIQPEVANNMRSVK